MKRALAWVMLIMFSCLASSQNIEIVSCERLIDENNKHLQLLKVGMKKSEVLAMMGSAKCAVPEGVIENPAKSYSFKSGADVVEVLSFIVAKTGQKQPAFKQITLKNGSYEKGKIGFITSPGSSS